MSFGTSMTVEQQAVIAEFNQVFGWTFDPKVRKDAETLWTMQDFSGLRGRPDIADKIVKLIAELHPSDKAEMGKAESRNGVAA